MPGRPRLARKARLVWDRIDAQHYLLWPERGLRLNATAAAIVALCDGDHDLEQIASALCAGADRREVLADVARVIASLRARNLIRECI